MAKEYPVCNSCGSERIVADAYASWDEFAQDWVLSNVFDYTKCDACGSTDIKWKPCEDGTSGQDRVSYSDSQDRDSYSTGDE